MHPDPARRQCEAPEDEWEEDSVAADAAYVSGVRPFVFAYLQKGMLLQFEPSTGAYSLLGCNGGCDGSILLCSVIQAPVALLHHGGSGVRRAPAAAAVVGGIIRCIFSQKLAPIDGSG